MQKSNDMQSLFTENSCKKCYYRYKILFKINYMEINLVKIWVEMEIKAIQNPENQMAVKITKITVYNRLLPLRTYIL